MKKEFVNILVIIVAAFIHAISLNVFLLPNDVFMGGVTGFATIISTVMNWNAGLVIFLINLPIFGLGLWKLGKKFVLYSFLAIITLSISMQVISVQSISKDVLITTIIGAVLNGASIGLLFRFKSSTGGIDIISLLISRKRDIPVGKVMIVFNGIIVMLTGVFFGTEMMLYTLLVIYLAGKSIDVIHTNHTKLSINIVTNKEQEIIDFVTHELKRGGTVYTTKGAYKQKENKSVNVILTKYELAQFKEGVRNIDPNSFIYISPIIETLGNFRKND